MTLSCCSSVKLLISASEMPSDRYSVSALPLAFSKGNTAMLFSGTDGTGEAIDEASTSWAGSFGDDWKRKNQAPIPPRSKITAAIPAHRIAFDFPTDASVDEAAFI